MITTLRKALSDKWVKVILWIPIVAMGLGSLLYYLPNSKRPYGANMVALTINGKDVEFQQLQRQMSREMGRVNMIRQQLGANADMFIKMYGLDNPRALATQSVITETLLDDLVANMHIQIDPKLVIQRLQDPSFIMQYYPDMVAFGVFNPDGSFNLPALKNYVIKTNQTMTDLEDTIENGLRRSLVTDTVNAAVYVGNTELKKAFTQEHLSKKFSIVSLPLDTYLTTIKKEGVTQDEIQQFFNKQNQQDKCYWTSEKRSGTVWTFLPEEYGITITDKQLQSYYEQNKHKKFIESPAQVQVRNIVLNIADEGKRQEITEKAQSIKEELTQDPKKFEALAKQYSDNKESAAKGGLMPFFSRGQKESAFERAAFRLRNDGDISDIISTPEGLHILQRVSKKPIAFKPFDSVKKEIQKTLLNQAFQDTFRKDLERKIRLFKENPQKFNEFVQEKKAVKKELKDSERTNSSEVSMLYKTKKNNWDFSVDATQGVVVLTTDIKKSCEPELSTVKARVEQDLLKHKANQRLQQDLELAKKQAQTKSMTAVQKQFGGSIEQTEWLNKDDVKKIAELEKRGVPVERMLMLDTVGSLILNSDAQHGFLIKLDEIEPFNDQLFTSKKNELMGRLYNEKKQLNQRGFIASLLRNATIKTVENESDSNNSFDDETV